MLMCQAFVPPMVKAGRGAVVNIGSTAAHIGLLQRRDLRDAEGCRGPLHALPRRGGAKRRRAHQRRQPRPDQDGALPGDAHRRSGQDGFGVEIAGRAMPSPPRSPTPWRSCWPAAADSSPARCCASTAARRSIPADAAAPLLRGDHHDLDEEVRGGELCFHRRPRRGVSGDAQASHTAFISANLPISVSQTFADRSFVLSVPAWAEDSSIRSRTCRVCSVTGSRQLGAVAGDEDEAVIRDRLACARPDLQSLWSCAVRPPFNCRRSAACRR